MSADLRRDHIDIFHGLSNELPLTMSKSGCRSVVTIHDLIFLRHPEFYKPIDRWIYNYKFRRACEHADRIIAISEFTKCDIMRYYDIPEDKIDVVYQGCDPAFSTSVSQARLTEVERKYDLPQRFVLYVGSIEERKNARLLIDAAKLAAEDGDIFDVVLVGRETAYSRQLRKEVEATSWGCRCHFFHNVPFADLPSFYRLATVFVYPSVIEGFGIPLLEALSAGVPAIGCTGSCLEEAGGPGSLYVDPHDSCALKSHILRLLNDGCERKRMVEEGYRYARRFSDERLCGDLLRVYEKLMS